MSYKLTEGYFWPIFGFLCLAGLLNIAGLIFFRIGLLATLPTTIFAFAHLYDKLKNHEA
jgi:membrane protein implicated in regulation of membrane protease activity